jgi:hypothetical protein
MSNRFCVNCGKQKSPPDRRKAQAANSRMLVTTLQRFQNPRGTICGPSAPVRLAYGSWAISGVCAATAQPRRDSVALFSGIAGYQLNVE